MSWQNVPSPDEDFHIWVPPGTYAVTAGVADSEQQTLLVDLKAGETFKLTFNFWAFWPFTLWQLLLVFTFALIFNIKGGNLLYFDFIAPIWSQIICLSIK